MVRSVSLRDGAEFRFNAQASGCDQSVLAAFVRSSACKSVIRRTLAMGSAYDAELAHWFEFLVISVTTANPATHNKGVPSIDVVLWCRARTMRHGFGNRGKSRLIRPTELDSPPVFTANDVKLHVRHSFSEISYRGEWLRNSKMKLWVTKWSTS